ncbi:hypothetical protein [Aidingimonas halophila]|uniref:Uncharacterized protein n=1 Tax=Aidingimonas halophila TaxID=574349 RepID=A0A1H3FM97_9GAMM|nr:hypothetical protein [Aidingimonas halophila]GHC38142.1 hypothetical protein GCM10008094_34330 [Aidingimonas halophila]SDX92060.1 hypothetical protein SAMN05443545_10881 [Aidingimonas halophila]
MSYQIETRLNGSNPVVQICDASSGSVRLAWEYPRELPDLTAEDEAMLALRREEAVHELFRRLFLLTTEQYLKGEVTEIPVER